MKTYTAQVGPENAERLGVSGPEGVEPAIDDIGEGSVQINDLDQLRARAAGTDGSITDDADGLQIWIGGEGFPVFDDREALVADALGMQSEFDVAKTAFDRAKKLYANAVALVVASAGSSEQAATLLSLDVPTVNELLTAAT